MQGGGGPPGVGMTAQHVQQAGWFKQGGVPGGGGGGGGAPAGLMGMRAPYAAGGRLGAGARYFPGVGPLQRSPPATPAPRPPTPTELLLLRQPAPHPPHPPQDDQLPPMTPQDQLTKFVEQL